MELIFSSFFRKNDRFARNPWTYFFVFLVANTLLSYFPISLETKLWIGLIGLGIPFVIALKKIWTPTVLSKTAFSWESIPRVSTWVWVVFLILAILLRFYKLTTLSTWPTSEEGLGGYYGIELIENGDWHFFYSYAQWPPLFVWSLGTFFKILGPSLETLWLFPAILSLLTIPLAFAAAKAFFSETFAFVFICLWAFNFEPLYLGRFCQGHEIEVLWQLAVLALLGTLLRQTSNKIKKITAAFLGFFTGTGFYTLHHWPVMVAFIFLAVLGMVIPHFESRKGILISFLTLLLSTSLPYLIIFFSTNHGIYLKSRWVFQGGTSPKEQFHLITQYLGSLFWGVNTDRFAFKPFWGGFLNPLAGTLFLLGLIFIFRSQEKHLKAWILFGLCLFLLPALLSNDLEMLRMLLVFPMLLTVCVMGLYELSEWMGNGPMGLTVVFILLCLSSGMDIYHLFGPYQKIWHSGTQTAILDVKSMERFRAFQLLGSVSRARGPGLIFTELETSPFDQTLAIAVYPFNAARNPGLAPESANWAGLLTNINFAPFLSQRFPQSHWFPLTSDAATPQGTLVLGIFSITRDNQKEFFNWLETERLLRRITSLLFDSPFGKPPRGVLEKLVQLEPLVRKDPFLESFIAERIFFFGLSCSDNSKSMEALSRGIRLGYPAANLYNDLGVLWWTLGDKDKARESFEAALHSPLNHTPALLNLRKLP